MALRGRRFSVQLPALLLMLATSGMAGASPPEDVRNRLEIRVEDGRESSAVVDHRNRRSAPLDDESGASSRLASNAWWLFTGLGLMALAALNSRKRLPQPQPHQRSSDPHTSDQDAYDRKGR
jgi:hypothetical protein